MNDLNNKTIMILRGLPASGKSTFAIEYVRENLDYIRINRDSIRQMLGVSFSKSIEKIVKGFRNVMVVEALNRGYNVIIDDTNLGDRNIRYFEQLCEKMKVNLIINDTFMNVDLDTLLYRNKNREKQVPEQVIIDMYNKFVNSEDVVKHENVKPSFVYDENKKKCIICDVDGTIALHWNRSPFEFDRVDEDVVNVPVIEMLSRMSFDEVDFVVVSGREGTKECMDKTRDWLMDNLPESIKQMRLYMRKEGDNRKDYIIKQEIYNEFIKNEYNVLFVLDDRNQTVDCWRNLGLPCFQVNYGNF